MHPMYSECTYFLVPGVPVNVYATFLVMDLDEINEGRMVSSFLLN